MKKAFALFLAILTLILSLTACDSEDNSDIPEGMQILASCDEYIIYAPVTWLLQTVIPEIPCTYVSSADKTCVYLMSDEFTASSIEEYWNTYKDGFSVYSDFTVSAEAQKAKFGNSESLKYEFTFTENETPYSAIQWFAVNNGKIYILTYLAKTKSDYSDESPYERYSEAAYLIMENFKFGNYESTSQSPSPIEDKDAPDGMMLASNPDIVSYKLYVPKDWKIDMQTGYTLAYTDDGSSVSVGYAVPSVTSSLEEYRAFLLEEYKKVYTEITPIPYEDKDYADIKLSGIPGAEYKFSAKINGTPVVVTQVFAVKGTYCYTITYTAENSAHDAEFKEIINNFKFK